MGGSILQGKEKIQDILSESNFYQEFIKILQNEGNTWLKDLEHRCLAIWLVSEMGVLPTPLPNEEENEQFAHTFSIIDVWMYINYTTENVSVGIKLRNVERPSSKILPISCMAHSGLSFVTTWYLSTII